MIKDEREVQDCTASGDQGIPLTKKQKLSKEYRQKVKIHGRKITNRIESKKLMKTFGKIERITI